MTHDKFDAAYKAAKEFLRRADAVMWITVEAPKPYRVAYCGKANGAMKRASLDLTRALAEMRKP